MKIIKRLHHYKNVDYASDLIPYLFSNSKHFTPEQYYTKLTELCPEFEHVWAQMMPTENEIQSMITNTYNEFYTRANNLVKITEHKLGVKIDPRYKLPYDMTYAEYERSILYRWGLYIPGICNPDIARHMCYNEQNSQNNEPVPDPARAYEVAWVNLHYSQSTVNKQMLIEWGILKTLNPELKQIKMPLNDDMAIYNAIWGVASGFPWQDIEFFINEGYLETKDLDARNANIRRLIKESGLPDDFQFQWIPSPDTIRNVANKYHNKQNTIIHNKKLRA